MEEIVVVKLDIDGDVDQVTESSPSPDEGNTTSNSKAADSSGVVGRKTPDTPGSDTPTTGSTTPTPNTVTVGSDEGEVKGETSEPTRLKRKALAIFGEDESTVSSSKCA